MTSQHPSPDREPAGRQRTRRSPAPHERLRDAERTKARILDAAVEVFSAKGFDRARVADIAARAGVNQQLISYYFGSKRGLYREIGRRWRAYEAEAIPEGLEFAEQIKRGVRASVDPRFGGRLLAWDGLYDTGEDDEGDEETRERNAQLQREVRALRERQRAGELDDRFDPAALILIGLSAGNALAVYPHLARGLFGTDTISPELVEHYAEQLARVISSLPAAAPPRVPDSSE
ncbi:TetR/AcrR family transcriptional regulator [Nonomuraea sp. NPDC050783]|uniref:TetR/AcrR family transcriptional regulator n=1 Tax=Nonomuraea sp. NPDC050783 TaxID=3154634 RepID=UPI0034659F5C